MKNILIFCGSPRKGGNSDLLCEQFMAGAQEAGHKVEKIFVQEHKIAPCLGCGYCQSHEGVCVQKDGMETMLEKMIKADVLVLASPVYFYSVSAQIKALMDRTVARYTEIQNKIMYYIIAAADTDLSHMERTIECFRGFAYCLEGSVEKGVVYGVGAWNKGDVKGSPRMAQAFEMGKNV